MIICDWHYRPTSDDSRHPASLDHFLSQGFETMTCKGDDPIRIEQIAEEAM